MPKNDKKDNIRIWTEKVFYYVELINTVSGFLINARDQLSKQQEKPVIPINGSREPDRSDSVIPDNSGLQPEDVKESGGG